MWKEFDLLHTAIQNIAQRGHREHAVFAAGAIKNPGNIRILQLVVRHDQTLSTRFLDGDVLTETQYTSKHIQNKFVDALAEMVRDEIIDEVKQSAYFSILVDASKDVRKSEQDSFVLHFYYSKQMHESFMDFKPATWLDAESNPVAYVVIIHSDNYNHNITIVQFGYCIVFSWTKVHSCIVYTHSGKASRRVNIRDDECGIRRNRDNTESAWLIDCTDSEGDAGEGDWVHSCGKDDSLSREHRVTTASIASTRQ